MCHAAPKHDVVIRAIWMDYLLLMHLFFCAFFSTRKLAFTEVNRYKIQKKHFLLNYEVCLSIFKIGLLVFKVDFYFDLDFPSFWYCFYKYTTLTLIKELK